MSGTFGNFTPVWPENLAAGVTVDETFVPFQLWAGEAQIVTSQGMAGADMSIFTVVARDTVNGNVLVPWNPNAADGAPVASAQGTFTFSAAPAANDTVTIAGNVITWAVASTTTPPEIPSAPMAGEQPLLTAGTVNIGTAVTAGTVNGDSIATTTLTAAQASALNLVEYINYFQSTLGVVAYVDTTGLIVTVEAAEAGTSGNSITIAKSSTAIAVSGSTLSGGTVDSSRPLSTSKAIGFLAQAAVSGSFVPYYTGGAPNHEVLVWPATINTIAERKAAFDGTNIQVSTLA